jgi:hypothetical protein
MDMTNVTFPYFKMKMDLTICDGVVLCAGKIVIPLTLIQEVLTALHCGHLGAARVGVLAHHGGRHD